jgi:hypothetical protein
VTERDYYFLVGITLLMIAIAVDVARWWWKQ